MPIPIPKRLSGYAIGNADAPLQVEAFLDIQCPYSKKAWPTLLEVMKEYGSDRLRLRLNAIVIVHHRQSWDATKAAVVVADGDPEKFFDFYGYLYDRQDEFSNAEFKERSQVDLHKLLAKFASDRGGVKKKGKFKEKLEKDEIINIAKGPVRQAAVRGVWSTPTYFINGVQATQLSSSSSLADWKEVLDPLLE